MTKDSLGDRMKSNYENRAKTFLTRRVPVIMRLDGKAFHTFTKKMGFARPYSDYMNWVMQETAKKLLKEIQGAKIAYIQSDEISILITDYNKLKTDAWYNYNIQKMTSVSAAIASTTFSDHIGSIAYFDSRVFNIPEHDVNNYFVWRQQDWTRNSIQLLAQYHFSHKELHKKSCKDIHDMLYKIGVNWADQEDKWKNGVVISKAGKGYPKYENLIFSNSGIVELAVLREE